LPAGEVKTFSATTHKAALDGRFSAGKFDGQSQLNVFDASTMSQHFFGEIVR
jgi:hypothetical protein